MVRTAAQMIRRAALLGPVPAPNEKVINYEDIETVAVGDEFCWLCGQPLGGWGLPKKKAIKPTFTNHDMARAPESKAICADCAFCLAKKELRFYSTIVTEDWMIHPSREQIRDILLKSPKPPFVFIVAVSGQKHLTIRASVAYSREAFPVQYEEQQLLVEPEELAPLLTMVEELYTVFNKEEILTGRYNQHRIRQFGLRRFLELQRLLDGKRRTRLFDLAVFVAQKREVSEDEQATQRESASSHKGVIQLGLDRIPGS